MDVILQAQHTAFVTQQLCQLLRIHAQQKVLLILDNADSVIGCKVRFGHKQHNIAISVPLTFNTRGTSGVMYLSEVGMCMLFLF